MVFPGGATFVCAQQYAMERQLGSVHNNLEAFKRKENNVRSVEEITRIGSIDRDSATYKKYNRTVREFDSTGNMVRSVVYFKDQRLLATAYAYNGNNQPIEKTMENAAGTAIIKIEYSYDRFGRKTNESTYPANNEPVQTTQWFYDDKGMPVKEIQDVYLFAKTYRYEYNAYGKRIKTVETNSEYEGIEWISLFEYTTSGQLVKQKWFRTDQPDTSYCYASYDANGNVTEIRSVELLMESKQVYTWSANGLLLKKAEWFTFPGKLFNSLPDYCEEREYDGKGNLVKTVSTERADKRVTVTEFRYRFYTRTAD